jgi:hypothetical protein
LGKTPAAMTILLMFLVPGCGSTETPPAGSSASPSTTPSPAADVPPWGLDTVRVPDSVAAIRSAFESFPDDLRGPVKYVKVLQRFDPLEIALSDGGRGSVLAFPWDKVRAFPTDPGSFAFTQAVADGRMEGYERIQVEDRSLDGGAPLVWVTSHEGSHHLMVFGDPDSLWVFVIDASSPETRATIASMFVESV